MERRGVAVPQLGRTWTPPSLPRPCRTTIGRMQDSGKAAPRPACHQRGHQRRRLAARTSASASGRRSDADRARRDAERRTLMAELLPFAAGQRFTFVDLGAGTGCGRPHRARPLPGRARHPRRLLAADDGPGRGRARAVRGPLQLRRVRPGRRGRLAGRDARTRSDAVISSLSVHHLDDARKQSPVRRDPRAPRTRRLVPELRPGAAAGPGGRGSVAAGRRPARPVGRGTSAST